MKHLFATILGVFLTIFVTATTSAQQLTVPFHNSFPTTVSYNGPAKWIKFDGQCHWPITEPAVAPTNALPDPLSHTHAAITSPMWGELGNFDVTLPVTITVYDNAATVSLIQGIYLGQSGQLSIPVVMDTPGPYVGNPAPNAPPVVYTGHMTINLGDDHIDHDGNDIGVPRHGWTSVMLFTRTIEPNGDQFDNQTVVSFYSVVDPSAPDAHTELTEAGVQTAIKCGNARPHDAKIASVFGLHLVEFKNQDLANILEQPFSTPQTIHVLGYNYGQDEGVVRADGTLDPSTGLASSDQGGIYTMLYNNDFHMGVQGLVNDSVIGVPFQGMTLNVDYIDPVKALSVKTPMNLPAGDNARFSFGWKRFTGPNGFIDELGQREPANIELVAWATFTGAIGPNPIGCSVITCPPIPVNTPVTTVTVPNVVGQLQTQVSQAFASVGLALGQTFFSPNGQVVAGTVLSESPVAGTQVSPGSAVNITVASTPVTLPPVWNCTGTVIGTSTNTGTTVNVTSGQLNCVKQ